MTLYLCNDILSWSKTKYWKLKNAIFHRESVAYVHSMFFHSRCTAFTGCKLIYIPGLFIVGLRPVIQILCHVLARGWGRWLRYFTEAKAEVKYRASARILGPKHDTRFELPVSILIMTRDPFLPFKTHKTSAKNPRLLMIAGAIWFCRYRQCTPSRLWMHAPVAKERRLMTSQYHIFDRMDNLNPRWMQAVNG